MNLDVVLALTLSSTESAGVSCEALVHRVQTTCGCRANEVGRDMAGWSRSLIYTIY